MSILRSILYAALFAAAAFAISHASAAPKADAQSLERGRYVAKIAGCNDCHTAGYLLSAGKVPEKDWLMGDSFGWRGDWGTTYPPNLRMYMANISEDQWIKNARALKARPPMPYYVVNEMHEGDLRAFYRFVKSLGPVGTQAPAYLPPGETPKGPYAQFPSAPK
jgi:hypothetical protein